MAMSSSDEDEAFDVPSRRRKSASSSKRSKRSKRSRSRSELDDFIVDDSEEDEDIAPERKRTRRSRSSKPRASRAKKAAAKPRKKKAPAKPRKRAPVRAAAPLFVPLHAPFAFALLCSAAHDSVCMCGLQAKKKGPAKPRAPAKPKKVLSCASAMHVIGITHSLTCVAVVNATAQGADT